MKTKLMGTAAAALLALAATGPARAQSMCMVEADGQQQVYRGFEPWYVASRPLTLHLDREKPKHVDDALEDAAEHVAARVELASVGATQPLLMGDMLYIGEIEGTPIYARQIEIGDLLPELAAHLRVTRDLDKVLDDKAFAARFANRVHTVYTMVGPGSTSCLVNG